MPVIGLDVGTTGSRAVLVDDDGRVLHVASAEHAPFDSPKTGWAEQHPSDWWRAAQVSLGRALQHGPCSADDVRAVGLSGQMHGAVLLGDSAEVLRPAIIWCDQRADAECRRLTETLGAKRLIDLVSNPALPGFTLPKLLWVRRCEPPIWDRIRTVLLPKDFVRFQLTGERATDVADASGTLLFDVAKRRWSAEMVDAAGIDDRWLPSAVEGPVVTGRVTAQAAAATGLGAGTPVVAGGGDQAAGAVGIGIVTPGAVSVTVGTSGVVFAATEEPARDPDGRIHTFCHAVPGRWHVMGVTQAAGLSLKWFRGRFGAGADDDDDRDPYDRLCAEAAEAPPGADGVLWAPYLMGERTPHLDAHARAALVGLAAPHTRPHVTRAILEGVAFSLKDSLTIFGEVGVPIERIRLGGGGARSPLWRQIQADVYGHAVEIPAVEEGSAFGAALLAGVGAGVWGSVDEACAEAVQVAARVEPSVDTASRLTRQYRRFRALYPALRAVNAAVREDDHG